MKKRKPPILLATLLVVLFGAIALIDGPLSKNAGVGKGSHDEEHGHEEEHHEEEAPKKPPVEPKLTSVEIAERINAQKMQARSQMFGEDGPSSEEDQKIMQMLVSKPIIALPPKPKPAEEKKPELERTGGQWYDPDTQLGSH